MKFRILFYKSKRGDGHKIDNLISMWTKLFNWDTKNYSHVELWMPHENGVFQGYDQNDPINKFEAKAFGTIDSSSIKFWGECFTSTMGQTGGRKGKGGACIRPASDILKNPDRWDYQDVECSEGQYMALESSIARMVENNKGYDKLVILSFFNPFGRWPCRKTMQMCQEAVWKACFEACILNTMKIFSPRRMSKRVRKFMLYPQNLGEIKPL